MNRKKMNRAGDALRFARFFQSLFQSLFKIYILNRL
jgi:hypothetical protein